MKIYNQYPAPLTQHYNKKTIINLLILLFTQNFYAQDWQWLKDGGSYNSFSENDGRNEEVFDIATDSQKNVYVLAQVGYSNLAIDGNPKTGWGGGTYLPDFALASFACDGTYRWSKIIGGGGVDNIKSIEVDSADNVYVAGTFTRQELQYNPPRIDNDVNIAYNDHRRMFLAKFTKDGVFQWIKRQEPLGSDYYQDISYEMYLGSDNYIYWLTSLQQGVFCDGALNNNLPNTHLYILKYDLNGNYISAQLLDYEESLNSGNGIKYFRNPFNGYHFLQGNKYLATSTLSIGGQPVTHPTFIACYDANGVFQWVRQNTDTTQFSVPKTRLFGMDFDENNNLYIAGRQYINGADSFLGYTNGTSVFSPFVLKTDLTASNLFWSTNSNFNGSNSNNYGIKYYNGVVSYAGYGAGTAYTWGNLSANVGCNPNCGYKPVLVHFDAQNGVTLAIKSLLADDGSENTGTFIAVDASGDYILGGGFGHYLYDMHGNQVINGGGRFDFFVAKLANESCSPMSLEDLEEQGLEIFPNPATDVLQIKTNQQMQSVKVFSMLGQLLIATNHLTATESNLDISNLQTGTYVLKISTIKGEMVEKLVVE